MNIIKFGSFDAEATIATDKYGCEHVVAVAKVTFSIADDGTCTLADEQVPLVMADEFIGEPGLSAPLFESDFAPFKPRCDVLVKGSAYAPGGRAATIVPVGFKVSSISKIFNVVGDRFWKVSGLKIGASRPQPFTEMPLCYDRAFGGVDNFHTDERKHHTYAPNPVGRGFHKNLNTKFVDGTPLPNTEERNRPVTAPNRPYRPLALGPLGRNWAPRYKLAGTYDQKWLDENFPFLPPDFDEAYFQTAPSDQQIDYPCGGERVDLLNLDPEGRMSFVLPDFTMPIKLVYRSRNEDLSPVIDTITLDPTGRRCMLVWRASSRLKDKPTFLYEVWIGVPNRARQRALEVGKRYIDWSEFNLPGAGA
jgi:hypothetical protein